MRQSGWLLILFSSASLALAAQTAPPSPAPPTAGPVVLKADFRPGEILRYKFEGQLALQARLHPAFAESARGAPSARRYRVEGELVVEFAPEKRENVLEGKLRFQGLQIKDWVSEAQPTELEALHRGVEASPLLVRVGSAEAVREIVPFNHPYHMDLSLLTQLARAVLFPLPEAMSATPGERREQLGTVLEDPTGTGRYAPRANMVVEYVGKVGIAQRPCAILRTTLSFPSQEAAAPPQVSQESQQAGLSAKTVVEAEAVLTHLLDLEAQRFPFVHVSDRFETRIVLRQEDPDAPVRFPLTALRVHGERQYSARLLEEAPPPGWEAELAAFENSLQPAAAAAPVSPALAASALPVTPAGDTSLGEVARQRRQQRQQAGQPRAAPVVEGAEELEKPPEGFVRYAHPQGGYSVLVSSGATLQQSDENVLILAENLADGGALVYALAAPEPKPREPDPQKGLEAMERGYFHGFVSGRPLSREDTTIDGKPARVTQFVAEKSGNRLRGEVAFVVTPTVVFSVTCMAPEVRYAALESTCNTVLGSIRVR